MREHILYSFETQPRAGGEGSDHAVLVGGSSVPLSAELAAQLQARIAEGSLAKADFAVADTDELDDVVGTLVAYGLLRPA